MPAFVPAPHLPPIRGRNGENHDIRDGTGSHFVVHADEVR
jgi:hypothetical protein